MSDIRSAGAELVVISPQLSAKSQELREKHGLDFPILFDEGLSFADKLAISHGFSNELQTIYGQFGINVGEANGDDVWRLPMPSQFLVNADGIITDVEVNPDYTNRPEPSEIIGRLAAC